MYEGDTSEEEPEDGEASLHRWPLERPAKGAGVDR